MPPNDFKKGCRCPACANSKISAVLRQTAKKKKALAAVRFDKISEDKGYTLLQPYDGAHKKYRLNTIEVMNSRQHLQTLNMDTDTLNVTCKKSS